jgi:hypothetical protein
MSNSAPSSPVDRSSEATAARKKAVPKTAVPQQHSDADGKVARGVRGRVSDAGRTGAAGVRAAADLGTRTARGSVSAVGHRVPGRTPRAQKTADAATASKLPLIAASLRLPAPGASINVGPVRATLPSGALYYGGLAAMLIAGTVELPVAAGAMVVGALWGRRWLVGLRPQLSVYDAAPGSAPAERRSAEEFPA